VRTGSDGSTRSLGWFDSSVNQFTDWAPFGVNRGVNYTYALIGKVSARKIGLDGIMVWNAPLAPGQGYDDPISMPSITGFEAPVVASNAIFADHIMINWAPVSGASNYYLQRVGADGSQKTLGWLGNVTSFEDWADLGVSAGVQYTYTLFASMNASRTSVTRVANTIGSENALTASTSFTDHIAVNWSAVPGAKGYVLKRMINGVLDKAIGWLGAGVTSWQDNSASGIKPGVNYTYQLIAGFGAPRGDGSFSSSSVIGTVAGTAIQFTATQGTYFSGISLNWSPVPNASDYKVMRRGDDGSSCVLGWLGNRTWFWDSPQIDAASRNPLLKPRVHYTYTLIAAFGTKDRNGGTDYSQQVTIGSASGSERSA